MRKILAGIVAVLAVVAAIYVGFWLMFVGGIVQIVEAVQEENVDAMEIAWGVVRVVFAGTATALTLYGIGFLAFLIADE